MAKIKFVMKIIVISICFILLIFDLKAQIPEKYFETAKGLESSYALNIDSVINLSQGCKLTYSSDSVFKCFHLTLKSGQILALDIRLKTNHRGFVVFKSDHDGFILLHERSDGSGNPVYIAKVDKESGVKERTD